MKIGLIQLTSVLDYKLNLEKISHFIEEGKKKGAHDFFLPEAFYSYSNGLEVTPYYLEKGNSHEKNVLELALKFKVNLWGGSCIYKKDGQFLNRALFVNKEGKIIAHYDKVHLFYFNNTAPGQVSHDEASKYKPGNSLTSLKINESWNLGASICYDVRFPELYRKYSLSGVNLLTVSSAFTVPTGKAHWHTLLRARAIENLSYVIASAQWGVHNERITTFGHSLIVSPWGEVEFDMGEKEAVAVWEINIDKIKEAREKLSNLWSNFLK